MQTKITENEKQLLDLLNEIWTIQHQWQYKLLDLLHYKETDHFARSVRMSLNFFEQTVARQKDTFAQKLLERAVPSENEK